MNDEPLVDQKYFEEDTIGKYIHKDDVYGKAPFISKLTFGWSFNILKLAHKTSLKLNFLGTLEGENKSEKFLKELDQIWHKKNYKSRKTCPLFIATLRANLSIIYI
jgi:hypothetical protein